TWSISASNGLPNGTNSFSDWRRRNWVEISKNDSAAILASTILPSGATSSTGLGKAFRIASLSDGTGRRCSAAEVMQQRSMQNRRTHPEGIGGPGADPP